MLLLIHVVIALTGLLAATVTLVSPSNTKISSCYGMLSGTLLTGTLLVIVNNASLLRTCMSGLLYTAVMYGGIMLAKKRLAASTATID